MEVEKKYSFKIINKAEAVDASVIEKTASQEFSFGQLKDLKKDIDIEIKKYEGLVKYEESVIENIKSFHPEIVEYYNTLTGEKQSAFLLFANSFTKLEKNKLLLKEMEEGIADVGNQINEIENLLK